MPSLAERVAEIREHQRRVEERASIEEVRVREGATKFQEQARAANLEAFNNFEQALGLKKKLGALAEAEGLKSPQIHELIAEPVAEAVELRLEWAGEPKRKYQEHVIVMRPRGFSSISVKWMVDGSVTVSGEKEFGSFDAPRLHYGLDKDDFEESIAKAYLNPRWNEKIIQIMFQGGAERTPESLRMEPDETDIPF